MDQGRKIDLERLKEVVNDPTRSRYARHKADESIKIIARQLKDPNITSFREQLIAAAKAGDLRAEWKIGSQMREYMKQERMEDPA